MAYVVENGYCFAGLYDLRDTIPQQFYQLFFGVFINHSNRKWLAVHALGSLPACIPYWLHLELRSKPALGGVVMPDVVKIKEQKSEWCWGTAGLTTTSPRLARGSCWACMCWVLGICQSLWWCKAEGTSSPTWRKKSVWLKEEIKHWSHSL